MDDLIKLLETCRDQLQQAELEHTALRAATRRLLDAVTHRLGTDAEALTPAIVMELRAAHTAEALLTAA